MKCEFEGIREEGRENITWNICLCIFNPSCHSSKWDWCVISICTGNFVIHLWIEIECLAQSYYLGRVQITGTQGGGGIKRFQSTEIFLSFFVNFSPLPFMDDWFVGILYRRALNKASHSSLLCPLTSLQSHKWSQRNGNKEKRQLLA